MQNLSSLSQSSAGNITCSKNFTVTGTTTLTGAVVQVSTTELQGDFTLTSGDNLLVTKGTLTVGAFSSATAGSGLALSSTVTGAMKVYSDDAGVAMTGSVRGFLSRVLLTVDHAGDMSVRGAMGQIKFKDGVDLTNGVSSGVEGYLEIAGTSNFAATAFVAGVTGVVELTTASTITAGGYLAGIASIYKSTATPTGDCAAFITRKGSTAKWPIGLFMPVGSITEGIKIGAKASTIGSGVALNAANADGSGIAGLIRVFGDDGGAVPASGVDINMIESRYLVATDLSSTDASIKAMRGHLRVAGAKLPSAATCAGLCGYLEISGTSVISTGINTAVSGMCEASDAVSGAANTIISAFCASTSGTWALSTARSTVLQVYGAAPFDSLFDIGNSATLITTELTGGTPVYARVYYNNKAYTVKLDTSA